MTSEESPGRTRQFKQGCKDYTLGFALALFAASTVLAHLIVWKQYVPASVHETAVPFFVVFSVAGLAVVAAAYTAPVRFYELMEADDGV